MNVDKRLGKEYTVKSYRRLIILVIHNYIEIIFWFALLYQIFLTNLIDGSNNSINLLQVINFSFVTMTSFGLTEIKANTNFGMLITLVQSSIGLFMSLVVISRFISFLPIPKSDDEQ